MIHLLFVGDGALDSVVVPHLVEVIVGANVEADSVAWARLHGDKSGHGYKRKLLFAIRQARARRLQGLVATVDADKDRPRRKLQQLRDGRESDRMASAHLPIGLGEAVPHLEAWLLDDPLAVREGLGLRADASIPSVRRTRNPKEALKELLSQSSRSGERPLEVWPDIAGKLRADRCNHANETGFKDFAEDLRVEIGPLISE